MAKQILTNCGIYLDKYEISSDFNSAVIDADTDIQDVTSFGDDTRQYLPGFKGVRIACSGFYNPTGNDAAIEARKDQSSSVFSIAASNAAGGVGFMSRSIIANYRPFVATIGQAGTFEFQAQSTTPPFIRGVLLDRRTALTATGTGTGSEAGAILAAQVGYAALHVFSASGTTPSLTVKIQSDDNSGFTSATDRITFTAATEAGAQWGSVNGAVTDTYWRAVWTISGTSPSFGFAVFFGIA